MSRIVAETELESEPYVDFPAPDPLTLLQVYLRLQKHLDCASYDRRIESRCRTDAGSHPDENDLRSLGSVTRLKR